MIVTQAHSEHVVATATAPRLRHMPRTVALIYLAFGALWIFFTDRLLVWLNLSPDHLLQLQTLKGWMFVLGSGVLVYLLLKRYERKSERATEALLQAQEEVRRMNAELEQRVTAR